MKALLIVWLVAMLNALVPRGYDAPSYRYEGTWESKADTQARFLAIAEAVVDVAYDPSERPIFRGAHSRANTAVLILAVAFWETRFRLDADIGRGKKARGDSGNSWCLMQLNIGRGKTQEGWSGPELVVDRRKCISAGLHLLQQTWGCGPDALDSLSTYASGQCVTAKSVDDATDPAEKHRLEAIRTTSAQRVRTALRWGAVVPRIYSDKAVMEDPEWPRAKED